MVITSAFHAAVTPVGRPVTVPIPVAPVVAMVILVNGELIQSVGLSDGVPAVLAAVTVSVPVAFTVPQPPVNGME
jgi:hypothetical protein